MDWHKDRRDYGPVYNTDIKHGLNCTDDGASYIRCKKCGFTMNKNRHLKDTGDGVGVPTISVTVTLC